MVAEEDRRARLPQERQEGPAGAALPALTFAVAAMLGTHAQAGLLNVTTLPLGVRGKDAVMHERRVRQCSVLAMHIQRMNFCSS